MPGNHERLVHAAVVHDAQPTRELDARELLRIDARLLEVTAERVEGAADMVVDVEDVEGRLRHRLDHRASSGHSSSAVPPSTSARSGSERLRHACWASATRSA